MSEQAVVEQQRDELTEVLAATGRGDRSAFARTYEIAAPRLFPIAVRLLGGREAAEEALQEAFLAMWRKAAQFDPRRGPAIAWMIAVVRNCAIDRLRADARDRPVGISWDDLSEKQLDQLAVKSSTSSHLGAAMRTCLHELEVSQRKAILLAYYHGLSHGELASRLAVPLGTAKSNVRRGIIRLRKCLKA